MLKITALWGLLLFGGRDGVHTVSTLIAWDVVGYSTFIFCSVPSGWI